VRFRISAIAICAIACLQLQATPTTLTEFPFQFREGLLWVEVTTPESAKPLNFLLDTGAEVSVINLSTAKRLGLSLAPKVKVRGVHASMTGHWPQTLSATASGVALPADFLVVDLSKLSRSCEKPLDGLIGADFFRDKVVQIDFAAQKVRLLKPDETSPAESALPLDLRHCGMRVRASVNGSKLQWLRVDTGCATSLHWVTRSVRPEECSSKVAIGLAKLNIPQKRMTVNLGEHTFQDVPTGLHRTAIFPGEAGLLGNGLLSRFSRVTIDAKAGWLILEGDPAQ
jgi:predicted aspartyl protease